MKSSRITINRWFQHFWKRLNIPGIEILINHQFVALFRRYCKSITDTLWEFTRKNFKCSSEFRETKKGTFRNWHFLSCSTPFHIDLSVKKQLGTNQNCTSFSEMATIKRKLISRERIWSPNQWLPFCHIVLFENTCKLALCLSFCLGILVPLKMPKLKYALFLHLSMQI